MMDICTIKNPQSSQRLRKKMRIIAITLAYHSKMSFCFFVIYFFLSNFCNDKTDINVFFYNFNGILCSVCVCIRFFFFTPGQYFIFTKQEKKNVGSGKSMSMSMSNVPDVFQEVVFSFHSLSS